MYGTDGTYLSNTGHYCEYSDRAMFNFMLISLFLLLIFLKIIFVLWHTNCRSKVCLVGKTALVTGGNSGIGYQIVLGLVQRGCKVIIADKTQDECLLENIYRETGSRNVVFKYVDLSSFKSIREFAKKMKKDEDQLDILINNAGIGRTLPEVTEDGLDMTMQVNYFSAFLLTRLLEDLLKKNGGRIIFTASVLSYFHKFSMEALERKVPESPFHLYPNAKLCLLMASNIFAEKLKEYGVTSNCYHPGLVGTSIYRNSFQQSTINSTGLVVKLLELGTFLFGKTAEQGAQTAIHLACANEVKNVTGEFFYETKLTWKPPIAHDKNLSEAIWKATEEIVNLN